MRNPGGFCSCRFPFLYYSKEDCTQGGIPSPRRRQAWHSHTRMKTSRVPSQEGKGKKKRGDEKSRLHLANSGWCRLCPMTTIIGMGGWRFAVPPRRKPIPLVSSSKVSRDPRLGRGPPACGRKVLHIWRLMAGLFGQPLSNELPWTAKQAPKSEGGFVERHKSHYASSKRRRLFLLCASAAAHFHGRSLL